MSKLKFPLKIKLNIANPTGINIARESSDAPVVDAPVVDAPVVDAPIVDAPVVDAPVVDADLVVDHKEGLHIIMIIPALPRISSICSFLCYCTACDAKFGFYCFVPGFL